MCPRETTQHGGSTMARGVRAAAAHSFGEEEEDYIDLDLSSSWGAAEFEFRVCNADEDLVSGRMHKAGVPRTGAKVFEADAAAGGGRRSTATVAPLRNSHGADVSSARAEGSRSTKPGKKSVHARLQASRAFFRSLFARTSCSDERSHGIGSASSSSSLCQMSGRAATRSSSSAAPTSTLRKIIEQEKLVDDAASSRQRKSFSGVIKWRPPTTVAPQHPPSSSTTTRRRSSCCSTSAGCPPAPLKRSSSARSESEGLIQGAIAYCKRSQQQRVLARKSISDGTAVLSSSSFLPTASSATSPR